ncbi:MAG: polyprenyl synthetase, partial [Flammeovirgaceae bacterium]|nr:polyprenyl synthetase [Flammeovirgaceae bacterium]
MNLNEIKKPIDNEMGKFKDKLSGSIRSESKLIDTVISYVLKRKGKQIRPIFVFLTAG